MEDFPDSPELQAILRQIEESDTVKIDVRHMRRQIKDVLTTLWVGQQAADDPEDCEEGYEDATYLGMVIRQEEEFSKGGAAEAIMYSARRKTVSR